MMPGTTLFGKIHLPPQRRHKASHPALPDPKTPPTGPMHILLTGSTGNLGAYILSSLLAYPASTISHITCLNRAPTASSRQHANHVARGLTTDFTRCTFLTTSLSKSNLGLSAPDRERLSNEVTHILHNAWPVDFNLSFASFGPSIQGVVNLINFAHSATHVVQFFFISSVSVVGRWSAMPGAAALVPEVVLEDWRTAKMGYGQSKLVSERLLVRAAGELGLKVGVLRVGQLAGPVNCGGGGGGGGGEGGAGEGMQGARWNEKEWLPSLVKSSVVLGKVPRDLGPMERVDWVPVDVCERIVGEIVVGGGGNEVEEQDKRKPKDRGIVRVYHVANPNQTTWGELLPAVIENLVDGNKLERVSFAEWVEALKKSVKQGKGDASDSNPAAKLVSFFEELQDKAVRFPKARAATLDTRESVKHSESLAKLEAVKREWMELWMKQWNFR